MPAFFLSLSQGSDRKASMATIPSMLSRPDKLGGFTAALLALALWALPLMVYQPNRLSSGEGRWLFEIFSPSLTALLGLSSLVFLALLAGCISAKLRGLLAFAGLVLLCLLVGLGAQYILPQGNPFARAGLGTGFWIAALALGLALADSIIKLRIAPLLRIVLLMGFSLCFLGLLSAGAWDQLSLLKEYENQPAFWDQALRHVILSLGSLVPAILIGVPLGIACHRLPFLRAISIPVLNILQTIPSLAMFGLLMLPLGWIAAIWPLAGEFGIRGIGAAPALFALFFYSLLPIVANTAVGFDKLDASILEAGRGMGMSKRQRLFQIELPLALPVILTGIRIVLVQNIGIVAVAGLIGGGGFGTFIFQGLNQTASELVILGAIPTAFLAFAAAVIMDSLISHMNGAEQ